MDYERMDREQSMNLIDMWFIVSQNKWRVIIPTVVLVALSALYAFTAPVWYRAEVLLKLADNKQAQGLLGQLGGGLGGLASLAGLDVGDNKSAEALGVLRSREFAASFIEDLNLLPVFYAKRWDAAAKRWKDKDPTDWPDIRDGVDYFDKTIFKAQEDKKTGLITLSVNWTDAKTAAAWANLLVERVNDRMRQRALTEGESTMNYLKQEMTASTVVTLQQSIGRVLETELQKLVLAKATREYAFRIIDRAQVPKWKDHPHRALIMAGAFFLGFGGSSIYLIWRHVARRRRALLGDSPSSGSA
jgi:uncharacterized protein involved in exopolysaccharide biosynthesis